MTIRVLAIDDEPLALLQLANYIRKIPFFELVSECQSALEARDIMEQEMIDAIFCDINMPDLNGMDFVRSLTVRPIVVFTTAYSEYAIDGYKVDAVDYLLKPIGFNDFQRAAMKVKDTYKLRYGQPRSEEALTTEKHGLAVPGGHSEDDTIFVKTEYRMVRLSISDIRYVEGMSEYLRIYLESQPKPIITLLSMKKMEEFLPQNFMRIHRSYIINLNKVQEVNKNRVILSKPKNAVSRSADDETNLPIGENYKEAFNAFLTTRYLGK